MLISRILDLEVQTIFLDPEGKLVVLDVKSNESVTFRFVAVYASTRAGQSGFFRRLEVLDGTSRSLIFVGDWNAILDRVEQADRRGDCRGLGNLSFVSN